MIYLNDKNIKDYPETNEARQFYESEVAEIKKSRKPYIFKDSRPIMRNMDGVLEPPRMQKLPKKSDDHDGTWRYATRAPRTLASGGVVWPRSENSFEFKEEKMLDPKKDYDLIFFILHKAEFFKKGKEYIIYDDSDKKNEMMYEKNRLRNDAHYLITSKNSPLSTTHVLRTVASACGVSHAFNEDKHDVEIRNLLASMIDQLDADPNTDKGYKWFCDFINNDSEVKIRAELQSSIDRGIINFNERDNNYYLRVDDNPFGRIISIVPTVELGKKFEHLLRTCTTSPALFEDIQKCNGTLNEETLSTYKATEGDKIKITKDIADIEKTIKGYEEKEVKWPQFMSFAYSYIENDGKKKSAEQLKEALRDKIKELESSI